MTTDSLSAIELALGIWRRRKRLAVVVFALVATAAASLARWLPDLYRATATVLVERQQVSEAFVRPTVTAELDTRIQTIRQEIMSRTRLTELVTEHNLYPELRARAPMTAIVERMSRDITLDLKSVDQITGRQTTIAFTVAYVNRDPETAARIANALASLYVEGNTRIRGRQATTTVEFLRKQLEAVKTDLDDQQRRADEFKSRYLGELPQQMDANLSSLERLNTQLRLNGENQLRALDRRERLEREVALAPQTQAGAVPGASELSTLKRQLAELRRSYTDEYPEIINLSLQIAAMEKQIAEQAAAVGDGDLHGEQTRMRLARALKDVDVEIGALKDEERVLRHAMSGYEMRVENAPRRQQEYLEISRGSQATAERYDTLLKRYEEAQLAENLEQGAGVEQFRILDPALTPREAAAPNRLRLLILGIAAALALTVLSALFAERRDTAFHTVQDLRRFSVVPVLVSIPTIVTKQAVRRQRWRLAVTTAMVVVSLALTVIGVRFLSQGNEEIVRVMART